MGGVGCLKMVCIKQQFEKEKRKLKVLNSRRGNKSFFLPLKVTPGEYPDLVKTNDEGERKS